MARKAGIQAEEATSLAGLGLCDAVRGRFARAVELGEVALELARELGDNPLQVRQLDTLGVLYGQLGHGSDALRYLEDARQLANTIGYRLGEGSCLADSAEIFIDQGRLPEAIERAELAVRIGEMIGSPQLAGGAGVVLAQAQLHAGALSQARSAIEAANRHRLRRNGDIIPALLGVIAMRQGDHQAAIAAFGHAMGAADRTLDSGEQIFASLDAKGSGPLRSGRLRSFHRRRASLPRRRGQRVPGRTCYYQRIRGRRSCPAIARRTGTRRSRRPFGARAPSRTWGRSRSRSRALACDFPSG
jgi:tetratricopeptide (TPR) repeat protein